MKGRYKLYLKEAEYVEEASWKTAKRYSSRAELEMGLGSLPETKGGNAKGGVQTPLWAIALASPLLAAAYAVCFVGWLAFAVGKAIIAGGIEAWKAVWNLVRLFEQWRYEKGKGKKDAKL